MQVTENDTHSCFIKRRGYELEIYRMLYPAVICITFKELLQVAKVHFLIGDKEYFNHIFHLRFLI